MADDFEMKWEAFEGKCRNCRNCGLRDGATNVVIYRGSRKAPLMIIGEAPGENEDIQGLPFVGRSGQLLQNLLGSYGFTGEDYHICNIAKCRPPQNRDPYPDEKQECFAYLKQQIGLVRPQAILCLGRPASTLMTGQTDSSIGALRGRFFFYDGIPMICTYHPAAGLRDLSLKRAVWDDLKKLARYLGLETAGGKN